MAVIDLPYGGNKFNSDDLKVYIRTTGRDYIIQGQTACSRAKHPKPMSLDCWLRDKYARNPDTKQAVNAVIMALTEPSRKLRAHAAEAIEMFADGQCSAPRVEDR